MERLQCGAMKALSRHIGARIRSLRLRLDLKQRELAAMLEVSDKAISNYEQGDSSPSPKNIIKIAKLGGVSIDWLLTGSTMDNQRTPEDEEISEDEIRLLIAYRKASRPRKRIILDLSETLATPRRREKHHDGGDVT